MKKAITAAIMAFVGTGAAWAQSSVTLWGVVDAALQRVSGDGNGSITRLVQGANRSSQIGFRGVEDLGGGMSASFWLEAGMNNDSGTFQPSNINNQPTGSALAGINGGQGLTFNRRSTVSLAGSFGEVRLGRDYIPAFWQSSLYDVFGHVGSASSFNLIGSLGSANGMQANVRASNSIGYFLPPNLGGFYGQVMYALGENPSNAAGGTKNNGDHFGGRLGYSFGAGNISYGYGRTRYTTGDYVQQGLAGTYDFAVAKLFAGIYRDAIRSALQPRNSAWYVGASIPFGVGEFKLSYTSANQNAGAGNNDGSQIGIGYVHNLSKRTALYATYSVVDNKGASVFYSNGRPTTTPGGNTTGAELGLRHLF